jgi:hypothetical protein
MSMADEADVRRIALSLPEVTQDPDGFMFRVRGKNVAWSWNERVDAKKARVRRPDVLAVRVANEWDKDALLAMDPDKFFTEPHYNGYPAVLVRLPAVDLEELEELLVNAWRCRAPRTLVRQFDKERGTR